MGRTKIKKVTKPTSMTNEVLAILEECFKLDFSINKACERAGIDPSTYFRYKKANPDICKRLEFFRGDIVYQAKRNLKNVIEKGDIDTSKWLLERKCKEEYSTKEIVDVKNIAAPVINIGLKI